MQIKWVNFWHAYQPPWQDRKILKDIVGQSYQYILDLFKKYETLSATINISGSLTELLIENGYEDLLKQIRFLVEKGRIELVGSAMYHPILPLIPKDQILRQIELNENIQKKVFGDFWRPKGFYLPELAVDAKVLKLLKRLKYQWALLDECSSNSPVNPSIKYKTNEGLYIVFRNRINSRTFVPDTLATLLEAPGDERAVVTATDMEMYGHRHIDVPKNFEKILQDNRLRVTTCSRFLESLSGEAVADIRPCSWETEQTDLDRGVPYPLWDDPENPIHQKMRRLISKIFKLLRQYKEDPRHAIAQSHLDKGIASCALWWCSRKKPSPFCPMTWNPDEVEKGLLELIRAIRSLESLNGRDKIAFEKQYHQLKQLIWKEHWEKSNL